MPKQHIWILLCHNIGPLTILYLNYFNNSTQLPFLRSQIMSSSSNRAFKSLRTCLQWERHWLDAAWTNQSSNLKHQFENYASDNFENTPPLTVGDPTWEFRQYFSENSTALTRGIESLECSAGNMEWISSDRLIVVTNIGRNFAGVK